MNNGDVYKMIEDKIIGMLQNGKVPWNCPYQTINKKRCRCYSHGSQRPYSLLNQMILSQPGEYWTFKQAKDAGYHIKRGAKSEKIFFWKVLNFIRGGFSPSMEAPELDTVPLLKYYSVFHESMVEGLPEKPIEEPKPDLTETIEEADAIVERYFASQDGLEFKHDDSTFPFYSPSRDLVSCPRKVQFTSLPEYYGSLFHEMVHSTGHKDRLDRNLQPGHRKQDYSREELVAEMGSASLCSQLGFPEATIDNSVAYCAGWLKALRDDPKWIVWAASRADAAVRFILREEEETAVPEE